MQRLPRQAYTAEFKAQALERVKAEGFAAASRALGVSQQTLRNWDKAAKAGTLSGAGNKPVTPEQMENSRLKAENARLKRELEIVKKAAAYFAKDAL